MKTLKITVDLSDSPKLVEALRMEAVRSGTSQKSLVVEALESYLSNRLENNFVLNAAANSFAEWDNREDEVYDNF